MECARPKNGDSNEKQDCHSFTLLIVTVHLQVPDLNEKVRNSAVI